MLPKYSVRKPLTVLVAVATIILLGVISFTQMHTDLFPEMEMPFVMVTTSYPGAAPEKVEQEVTKPLEQALQGLGSVAGISSVSRENVSSIRVDFVQGTDIDRAIQEMTGPVDSVQASFAGAVGSPTISKMNAAMMPVMIVGISLDNMDSSEATGYIKEIMPRLEGINGVAEISSFGILEEQLEVRISQAKLDQLNDKLAAKLIDQYNNTPPVQGEANEGEGQPDEQQGEGGDEGEGHPQDGQAQDSGQANFDINAAFNNARIDKAISKQMISGVLASQNFSMPAGYVETDDGSQPVKVGRNLESKEQVEQLVLMDTGENSVGVIRLADVADVEFTNNAADTYARINGRDGIILKFSKQASASTSEVAKAIKAEFDALQEEQSGLGISLLQDQGVFIDVVTQSVIQNLLTGGLLAVIILAVFLGDIRPTLIIALSIPASLMFAVALMYFSGVTLNVISLGGLALAVGMLVDNSIVAIENIYRLRGMGVPAARAAVEGAKQVAGPLVSSTLTTVCVFMPVLFIQGLARQLVQDMALTIAFSLMASLIIALSLVPAAASGMLNRAEEKRRPRFERFSARYQGVLNFCLNHNFIVLAVAVFLLVAVIIPVPNMAISMIPSTNSSQMSATMKMPADTDENMLNETNDRVLQQMLNVDGVQVVGALKGGGSMASATSGSGQQQNEISYYLLLDEGNRRPNAEIREEILEKTSGLGGEVSVSASAMDNMAAMMTGGAGIEVEIKGENLDTLAAIGGHITEMLGSIEGTYDITHGMADTTSEKRIVIDYDIAMYYGFTASQVYQQVAQALAESITATDVTINGKVYPLVVTEDDALRLDNDKLEGYTFTTTSQSDGGSKDVRLSEIASFEDAASPSAINRNGQSRVLTATAEVDDDHNITLVARELQKHLDNYNLPDGYTVDIVGANESIGSTMRDVAFMMIVALLIIYMIMVAQFQSFLSPFIIMFTIPLAFTGGMLALHLTGSELSVIALLGFLMLSGVVVNNGIVFVDYTNELRLSGMDRREALLEAGAARMRPILMTALTTILGLFALALGVGSGAELLQPLGIVIIGGLLYATALTLLVVPVLYNLLCRRQPKARTREDREAPIEMRTNLQSDDSRADGQTEAEEQLADRPGWTQPRQPWGGRQHRERRPKPRQSWGQVNRSASSIRPRQNRM